MHDVTRWTKARVAHRTTWDDGLFTLRLDEVRSFEPGQFAKLGLVLDGEDVYRAYSIASAPGEALEFYVVRVDEGRLTPHLDRLAPGDELWVHQNIAGGFTLAKIPEDEARTLWLLGTGTGLAPYISMLRAGRLWDRFDRAVVVHGVRNGSQLGYQEELRAAVGERPLIYLPATTRDDTPGALRGRLTTLLQDGSLERAADEPIALGRSHVMICGNPDLLNDLKMMLAERQMLLHTPKRHGSVHIERYW